MRTWKKLSLTAVAALIVAAPAAQAAPAGAEVYVIGALHKLHETEPAFGYDELRRVIEAARPDVLVLEVRLDELAERKATPGRPEYPAVIWPYLAARSVVALPMEPGGETFARMTGAAGAQIEAMGKRDAKAAEAWRGVQKSLSTALLAYWRHPADSQDRVTSDLARAVAVRQSELAGPGFGAAQAEWDGYMAERAREAVLSNPGRRVVVLGSYRNREIIEQAVRAAAPDRVVEVEPWLRGLSRPSGRN